MKKQRITIMYLLLGFTFFILLLRLFYLTIIKGDYYKDFSENKRMKQINTYAARGTIFDRNGKVLAGNKPVYNLILYKDRLDRIELNKKNKVLLDLVNIFEEEGISYLEDFFFGIYEFRYLKISDYFIESKNPKGKVVDIILKNNLMDKIVNSKISVGGTKNVDYYPVNRIIDYLQTRGKNYPVKINKETGKIEFEKGDKYNKLIESKIINQNTDAKEYLLNGIKDDTSIMYNLVNHPLSRKIIYEILKKDGLSENIDLTDLIFNADLNFIEHKSYLNKLSNKITMDSNPKDDFLNLVTEKSLDKLLQSSKKIKDKKIIPADKLIIMLENIGIKTNLKYEEVKDSDNIKIVYKKQNIKDEEFALDRLIRLAKENDQVSKLVFDSEVVQLAEDSLINNGIYPKIYKNKWKYSYESDKEDLFKRNGLKKDTKAKEFLADYKKEFKLDLYDDYETFGIISIYSKLEKQGYLAYIPIDLARNIKQKSLAVIEEGIPKDYGFEIVVMPNRYYPNGSTASHLLGYLGNISEDFELEEYVNHKKYDFNDVVGKSGLEESFEDTLRGSKGKRTVYTSVVGHTTDILEEIPSIPGNNLYTSIDLDLQKETERIVYDLVYAMKNKIPYNSFTGTEHPVEAPNASSAAAVVMDVKTGEILSMASYPDFDPNLFVNGISEYDWKSLTNNSDNNVYNPRPLMNIATQAAIPPGSTFKTVTGLTALEKGLNPAQIITCKGYMQVGDTVFKDFIWGLNQQSHGPIDLYEALKHSCNYYFFALALGKNPKVEGELDLKVDLDDITKMVEKVKLNKPTGVEINIPYEVGGFSPSLYGKQNITRIMLRDFLTKNLIKYKSREISMQDYNNHINTILSWIGRDEVVSRKYVINELNSMGYYAEKPIDGNSGIADIIKYSYINQAVWTEADSLNMVIGQGQNSYTPMQMVQLASIIANRGILNKPTLIKEIRNFDNSQSVFKKEIQSERIDVDKKHFEAIVEGMDRTYDTINSRAKLPVRMAAKTGTAETGIINPKTKKFYEDLAWEIGFSPTENPEIATVIVVIQGEVSTYASYANTDLVYAYNKYVKKDNRFKNERKSYLR